jgi:hypothetical protein
MPEKGPDVGDNRNIFSFTSAGGADGTGLMWVADFGATAPTDATTAPPAAYRNVGMITDDGLTAKFSETTKKIKAAGSTAIQRVLVTDVEYGFDVAFLEANQYSMAVFNRLAINAITPTVGTGAFSFTNGTYTRRQYAMIFDMIDGTNHFRAYCPNIEVTDRKDTKFANANEASFGISLTAYTNTSGVATQWYVVMSALG